MRSRIPKLQRDTWADEAKNRTNHRVYGERILMLLEDIDQLEEKLKKYKEATFEAAFNAIPPDQIVLPATKKTP